GFAVELQAARVPGEALVAVTTRVAPDQLAHTLAQRDGHGVGGWGRPQPQQDAAGLLVPLRGGPARLERDLAQLTEDVFLRLVDAHRGGEDDLDQLRRLARRRHDAQLDLGPVGDGLALDPRLLFRRHGAQAADQPALALRP